jgi:hypothetical protein
MGMEQFNPLKRPAHVISKQFRSTSMCISQIGRLSRWGLGIFLAAGLTACGASDQRDAVLPSAGALGADTAIATGQPTAAAQASVTAPATAMPQPSSIPPTTASPAEAQKETAMPDQTSAQPEQDHPTDVPDNRRPTFQVGATPEPAGATPAGQSGGPIGVTMPPPFEPALAALVEGAKADLAQRRSVAIDSIAVVEVRSVTWPDAGVGCPQPGMVYKQVPVDGLLIRLSVSGSTFNYHGGGRKPPFLCEQGAQDKRPAPPPGADQ